MDVSVHSIEEYLSKIITIQKANQEKYRQNQIFLEDNHKSVSLNGQ